MQPNFYSILPAKVRYAKINASAKVLFAEITALTSKYGYCNASNSYFSQAFDTTTVNVSRWMKTLSNEGFIRVEMEREGKRIVERKIYVKMDMVGNPLNIDTSNEAFEYSKEDINKKVINKNVKKGINKNVKGINTRVSINIEEENKIKDKVIEETVDINHIKKAVEYEKFLFSKDGEFKLNAIKENRTIKKKKFSDERIVDEIFKFFSHHQLNSYIMTQQIDSHVLKSEFERWLSRDLCKSDKIKTSTATKSKYISNSESSKQRISLSIPKQFDLKILKILETHTAPFNDLANLERAKAQNIERVYSILRLRLINNVIENKINATDFFKDLNKLNDNE